jgi:DNA invertase Pin-like site-specific DNA recombinase
MPSYAKRAWGKDGRRGYATPTGLCGGDIAQRIEECQTDRAELAKLLKRLGEGDVLMVTRLDRLARSTRDLLNILDTIAKAGAGFKSLTDTWADTTTAHGRLMLTVLGGLAEFERELILARTGEGRKRAQARGLAVRLPRPAKRLAEGATQADLARTYGVSQATISRLEPSRPFEGASVAVG